MKNVNSAPHSIEWDYSPWSEIGRNDSPGDVLKIPGPYPLSDGWLRFWLAVYRLKRSFRRRKKNVGS